MRILIYTAFPPVSGGLLGGAQRYLDKLLSAFNEFDVDITVVCPPRSGRRLVEPTPRFRIVDQLRALVEADHAEQVGPADVHHDMRLLCQLAADADVVVSIDEHFPVHVDAPVVLWLNNFSYPPETRSVFGCSWDAVVVPSEYVRRCLDWYLPRGSWWPQQPEVHVIAPAISMPTAAPVHVPAWDDDGRMTLVFPHRPDPDKGFETALLAIRELSRRGQGVRLLVPDPKPDLLWPHQVQYTHQRRELIHRLGLDETVILHPWIDGTEMPAYLASATWTLCPSELPESFGLVVIESLAAATPVVATPAGAFAELVPEGHGVQLVEFGDWVAMADIITKGVDKDAVERGRARVAEAYTATSCASHWLRVLADTAKTQTRYTPVEIVGHAPPWRRQLPSGRIWDDYAKRYAESNEVGR